MCNNLTIVLLFLILCSACNHSHNNVSSESLSDTHITHNINNNIIEIKSTDSITHTVKIKIFDNDSACTKLLLDPYVFNGPQKLCLNVDSIIRCSKNLIDLSYKFIKDPNLPLVIIIDDNYKINFEYKYCQKNNEDMTYAKIVRGSAVCLVKEESVVPEIEEIRKWLYDNNNYMEDSCINLMYNIYKDLSYKKTNNYCLENTKSIPIMKDFSGIKYRIKTNMIADYYYLFATDDKLDLEIFIRDAVSNNFVGSLSNAKDAFSCYRAKGKGGLLTIFFIGIDKKWNKQMIPVGMVCIDNKSPYIITQNESNINNNYLIHNRENRVRKVDGLYLNKSTNNGFSNHHIESKVENKFKWDICNNFESLGFNIKEIPSVNTVESIIVKGNDFRGNIADFTISFSKNVKSITFEYKDVKKKLNLIDKTSPYFFSCYLPLNLGDNFIRINAEDKFGNTTEQIKINDDNNTSLYEKLKNSKGALFYVKMVKTKNITPDININMYNDVDINVW